MGVSDGIDLPRVLTAIGVFRAVPFSLKEFVYDDGTWMKTYPLAQKNIEGAIRSARNLAGLHALSKISATTSARSTFKYIQNNLTHRPFYIDVQTCLPSLSPFDEEAARACALDAIIQWLGWLKEEGIYDNTMIVLVSDHGSRKFGSNLGMPLSRTNALLMVKEFNQRGELEQSDTFMSNADVPAIVCAVVGGCPDIADDPRHGSPSRTLYFVKGKNNKNSQRISDDNTIYQVKKSIFEPDNWSIVK